MPTFDVITTKTTRISAANIGEAAEKAEKIENGDMAKPPDVQQGKIFVNQVNLVPAGSGGL